MTKREFQDELALVFYYQYLEKTPVFKQAFLQSSMKDVIDNYGKFSDGGRYVEEVVKVLLRGLTVKNYMLTSEVISDLKSAADNKAKTMRDIIADLSEKLWAPPFHDIF